MVLVNVVHIRSVGDAAVSACSIFGLDCCYLFSAMVNNTSVVVSTSTTSDSGST